LRSATSKGELTYFIANSGATMPLNALQTVRWGYFQVRGGASLALPSLQAVPNTSLFRSGGGSISATNGAATYSSTDQWVNDGSSNANNYSYNMSQATGACSRLNLSALQSIDAGFSDSGNDHNHQLVTASGGGVIDLSGVL